MQLPQPAENKDDEKSLQLPQPAENRMMRKSAATSATEEHKDDDGRGTDCEMTSDDSNDDKDGDGRGTDCEMTLMMIQMMIKMVMDVVQIVR